MMTSGDLFVCLVVGLAVPLAILDATRTLMEDVLPFQRQGFQIERRLAPWLLALFAGPALFLDRMVEGFRQDALSQADIANGVVIIVGWAAIYGFVLLKAVHFLSA